MSCVILIDWLGISAKNLTVEQMQYQLGMQNCKWEDMKGHNFYRDSVYCNGVRINNGGEVNQGIHMEMSGQGCRYFETYGNGDFSALFEMVRQSRDTMNITRLDVAFDDTEGLLDIDRICSDVEQQNYTSKMKSWNVVKGNNGNSVTIGSRSSDILIRIYDKAKERGYCDGRHWIRVELQLRQDLAYEFTKHESDFGSAFKGVLSTYLNFRVRSDRNEQKCRWDLTDYWLNFLDGVGKIKLYSKVGYEYNLSNLDNMVFHQSGNAVDTAFKIYGYEGFLFRLKARSTNPNPKYEKLLEQFENSKLDLKSTLHKPNRTDDFKEITDETQINILNEIFKTTE